jgi:HAD superfamily phosphoserine phosphatase-like hydrolase
MNYRDYSPELWKFITEKLDLALKSEPGPHYAAFDADGTLWSNDLGESFFKYQISNSNLKLPDNPWRYYRDWKESGDPRPAYLWLAQINSGITIDQVRAWSEAHLKSLSPMPTFQGQARLIDWLHERNVKVFVVTASITWSVEPGAKLYNIQADRVLGVETKIEKGVVTTVQQGEITYREGKVARLLAATGGIAPILASGNSLGDYHLLKSAKYISLAVSSTKAGDELYEAEQNLKNTATENQWLTHNFLF